MLKLRRKGKVEAVSYITVGEVAIKDSRLVGCYIKYYLLIFVLTECFLSNKPLTAVLFIILFVYVDGLYTLNKVPLGLVRDGLSHYYEVNW